MKDKPDEKRELHDRYLKNKRPEMMTMLVCSLLDISDIKITDNILVLCSLLGAAHRLNGATLYRNSEGSWRTKHSRWDKELFSFIYKKNGGILMEQRKQDLEDSLCAIYKLKEEDITHSAIAALYHIAVQGFVPIEVADTAFQRSTGKVPTYLTDDEEKSEIYTAHVARAYFMLNKFQECIDKLNHAIVLNTRNIKAINNKGMLLMKLGRYPEAVECFEKGSEIDPNLVEVNSNLATVWLRQGDAFESSQNHKQAIKCYNKAILYYNKGIEIDPDLVVTWVNLCVCFHHLGKYEEALGSYDEAREVIKHLRSSTVNMNEYPISDSFEASIWFRKGLTNERLEKYYEAIDNYDNSLKLNPEDAIAWLNKGHCYHRFGIIEYKAMQKAIECYDEALRIDPNQANAKHLKSLALETWPHLRDRQNWE